MTRSAERGSSRAGAGRPAWSGRKRRLLDHFGSLRGVLDADARDRAQRLGIGEDMAAQLAALLR